MKQGFMGSYAANPYVFPTLAHGGILGLIGLYGLMNWRRSPRLAITGVAALLLFSLYLAYGLVMLQGPDEFVSEFTTFQHHLPWLIFLFLIASGFQLISFFLNEEKARVVLFVTVIATAVTGVIFFTAIKNFHETLGMVTYAAKDHGLAGWMPLPIWSKNQILIISLMLAFPLIAMAASSRLLLSKAQDWLLLSPYTLIPGLAAFILSISSLYVQVKATDYSQMMILMHILFFAVLAICANTLQSLIPTDSITLRRLLGGTAIGLYAATLLQVFSLPFTSIHLKDVWIAAGIAIVVGGYLLFMIYIKLATRFGAELEELRMERLAAIGRLASITAHEIRNPLQAIRGLSQFLTVKSDNPEIKESAEVIMKETDHLDVILKRLLDYSREMTLNLDKVDVKHWWEELKSVAIEIASTSGINCEWVDPEVDYATFDQDRMRQVFVNVFKNAIEASPEDSKVYANLTHEKGFLILRIRNEGERISSKDANNAFKEFHTTKADGSGLGLPLSKRIVEAHHGKIYFDIKADNGTTVVIEWPITPPRSLLRRMEAE